MDGESNPRSSVYYYSLSATVDVRSHLDQVTSMASTRRRPLTAYPSAFQMRRQVGRSSGDWREKPDAIAVTAAIEAQLSALLLLAEARRRRAVAAAFDRAHAHNALVDRRFNAVVVLDVDLRQRVRLVHRALLQVTDRRLVHNVARGRRKVVASSSRKPVKLVLAGSWFLLEARSSECEELACVARECAVGPAPLLLLRSHQQQQQQRPSCLPVSVSRLLLSVSSVCVRSCSMASLAERSIVAYAATVLVLLLLLLLLLLGEEGGWARSGHCLRRTIDAFTLENERMRRRTARRSA